MRLGLGDQRQKLKFKSEARNRILNGPEDSPDPFISWEKLFLQITLCRFSKLMSHDARRKIDPVILG